MNKDTSIRYILLSLLFLGCNLENRKTNSVKKEAKEPIYCVKENQFLGKQFLYTKFLEQISAIQTNSKNVNTFDGMVLISGGKFQMGGDFPEGYKTKPKTAIPQADELPKHAVEVTDFYMDDHEVTIGEFMKFVKATGYKTVAEYDLDWEELKKQVPAGMSKPSDDLLSAGALVFNYADKKADSKDLSNWWRFVKGAYWKNPSGELINTEDSKNLPVTQVSWYDAQAYAKWMGKRLPTEAEYEYAMRGGKSETVYPWGNDKTTHKTDQGNFLQGEFPYTNTGKDGFVNIAPVKSFPPNSYGLYDIAGNVWEWTSDWYGADYYEKLLKKGSIAINPQGPEQTYEVYNVKAVNKVVRGGSFLCNDNWCSGYRNARRMRLSPDSGMQHLGFRLVRSKQ